MFNIKSIGVSSFRNACSAFTVLLAGFALLVLSQNATGSGLSAQAQGDSREAFPEDSRALEILDVARTESGEKNIIFSVKARGLGPFLNSASDALPVGDASDEAEASRERKQKKATVDERDAAATALESELNLQAAGIPVSIVRNSLNVGSNGGVVFDAQLTRPGRRGRAQIEVDLVLEHKGRISSPYAITLPGRESELSGPGEQPLILKIGPAGGTIGDTITITGRNFGGDIDEIQIRLEDQFRKKADESRFEENRHEFRLITWVTPFYLSPVLNSQSDQELRFTVPPGYPDLSGDQFLSNQISISVTRGGRKSNRLQLAVARDDWRFKSAGISVVLMIFLLVLVFVTARSRAFLQTMILDGNTNTYSLSRCQALFWTLILGGSYVYMTIGAGLILGGGVIPDFNSSLLVLMGISYGGLLSSAAASTRYPKNELNHKPLRMSNLYAEGGKISVPRLQLLIFTIISAVVYLYILYTADIIATGLPDVPPTLLGLMGISQSGYLGDKVLGGRFSVSYVLPSRVALNKSDANLTLIGTGFLPNTNVMIEGVPEAIPARFLNANSLAVPLPEFTTPGSRQIVLVPPTGASVTLTGMFAAGESEEGQQSEKNAASDKSAAVAPLREPVSPPGI
ncbi:MAG: IPT/TIG domain-containing protein [bacterium]|nr:IPT/TIG domain-containing protein [bacterium]